VAARRIRAAHSETHLRVLERLRIRSLLVLVTIVDAGGVVRAADELGMTQPAVTRTIRELEQVLGVTLFSKAGRGIAPTPIGASLYRHSRHVLSQLRLTAEEIEAAETGGYVRVGVLLAAASGLLPRAIMRFKERFPTVTVTLRDRAGEQLLPDLIAGELDMILGRVSPLDQRAGLVHEVLYEEPIVLCCRAGHPIFKGAERLRIGIEQARRYPWILPPRGLGLRHQIDSALQTANVRPPAEVVESVATLVNRSLLLNSDMMVFVPAQVVAEDVALGLLKAIPVPFDLTSDPVAVTFRAKDDLSPAAAQFAVCLRESTRAKPSKNSRT
jgi:DNA-binding transcriptional LysR family regulator